MLAWERQRRLQDKYNYIQELDRVANFSWEDWRKRVSIQEESLILTRLSFVIRSLKLSHYSS